MSDRLLAIGVGTIVGTVLVCAVIVAGNIIRIADALDRAYPKPAQAEVRK